MSLVEHPGLEDWHPHLTWALEEQRVIHRGASYSRPSIEQVQDTLNSGPPANPADLKVLLIDRLSDMCNDLRGGSSDFWSPEEARKISVIVMDVTKPGTGLHSRSLQPDPRGVTRVT